jgi:hypothetical protein
MRQKAGGAVTVVGYKRRKKASVENTVTSFDGDVILAF